MATRYISGGDKLQARLAEIGQKLKKARAVRIGFLEGSTYPDGTSVPLIAALNEFGVPSKGQPPRPAFRNMVAAKSGEWPDAISAQLTAADYDADIALGRVGQGVAGQLRQSISDITTPPLAASTIRRKGSDKPWIDTGHLLASVDYQVE